MTQSFPAAARREDLPELTRRDKVLWTAAKLFLAKGFSAASVDEIAAEAGTTGPALYRLFESKQDLLDQLCLVGMEVRVQGIEDTIEKGYSDPLDTLQDLIRTRINFAFGPWGYQVPITLAEYRYLSPSAAKQIDAASQLGIAELFRCMVQIRPQTTTREILARIYDVLMEITYVALHLDDLRLKGDVRAMLQRLAMAGLTGGLAAESDATVGVAASA